MFCLAPSPFWSGLGWVTRSFLGQNPSSSHLLALGEILNPAQRIRVEGFEHVRTAGARQVMFKLRILSIWDSDEFKPRKTQHTTLEIG
jgi:hypothetical protein